MNFRLTICVFLALLSLAIEAAPQTICQKYATTFTCGPKCVQCCNVKKTAQQRFLQLFHLDVFRNMTSSTEKHNPYLPVTLYRLLANAMRCDQITSPLASKDDLKALGDVTLKRVSELYLESFLSHGIPRDEAESIDIKASITNEPRPSPATANWGDSIATGPVNMDLVSRNILPTIPHSHMSKKRQGGTPMTVAQYVADFWFPFVNNYTQSPAGFQNGPQINTTINIGDTVSWMKDPNSVNVHNVVHSLRFPTTQETCRAQLSPPAGFTPLFHSPDFDNTNSFSYTFNVAGYYFYLCSYHCQFIQWGLITVLDDSGNPPTTSYIQPAPFSTTAPPTSPPTSTPTSPPPTSPPPTSPPPTSPPPTSPPPTSPPPTSPPPTSPPPTSPPPTSPPPTSPPPTSPPPTSPPPTSTPPTSPPTSPVNPPTTPPVNPPTTPPVNPPTTPTTSIATAGATSISTATTNGGQGGLQVYTFINFEKTHHDDDDDESSK